MVLAIMVANGSTVAFDAALRNQIHASATGLRTGAAQWITLAGSAKVWGPGLAIAIAGFWIAGDRRPVLALGIVMAGATLLDNGLKVAFHRVRPEAFFGALPDTYSFPSGHALFSLCFYGALALIFAKHLRSKFSQRVLWIGAALLVLCIGASRVYLGVHYPTDVLAGYLAGGAWLFAMCGTGLIGSARAASAAQP